MTSNGTDTVQYSADVSEALDELFPSDDPLYAPDFDVVAHINRMFPTEQSLSGMDEAIAQVVLRITPSRIDSMHLVRSKRKWPTSTLNWRN